jgi:hypothetical protein
MRVISAMGEETEAFVGACRVTVLGGPVLSVADFYRTYVRIPERRNGDRRVQRERRKVEMCGRRHRGSSRRRGDAITAAEWDRLREGAVPV